MGIRLSLWELHPTAECEGCERLGGLRDFSAARRLLDRFKSSVIAMGALRDRLWRESRGSWLLDRATDDMIIEQAARLLSAGLWHVHTSGSSHRFVDAKEEPRNGGLARVNESTPGAAPKAAPARALSVTAADGKAPVKSTWIEIRLFDQDDRPVAGESYEIRFSDGSLATGKLSANGKTRYDGSVPGQCEVRFPDLEANEWKRV